jgi:hypothetical protein
MREQIVDPPAFACRTRNPQASIASRRAKLAIDFMQQNQPFTPIPTANSLTRAVHLNQKKSQRKPGSPPGFRICGTLER